VWIIDSGATCHLQGTTTDHVIPSDDNTNPITVNAFGGKSLTSSKIGKSHINTNVTISEVARIPNGEANLLSVAAICDDNNTVVFTKHGCDIIQSSGKVLLYAPRNGNLYTVPITKTATSYYNTSRNVTTYDTLHRRLGHMHTIRIDTLHNHPDISDHISRFSPSTHTKCISCTVCKATRPSIGKSAMLPHPHILDCCYSDIKEFPISDNGARYFLTCIDSSSRFTQVYILKAKSDATAAIKQYFDYCRVIHNRVPKLFHTDNAPDLCAGALPEFFAAQKTGLSTCPPNTPEFNGVAERKNRSLDECARTLLHTAKLPMTFYPLAVKHACDIQNRWPHASTRNRIPAALWTNNPVTYADLRVFGCDVYCLKRPEHQDITRAQLGIFVGIQERNKCSKVYMPVTGRVWNVRQPTFVESSFTRPLDSNAFARSGSAYEDALEPSSNPPLFTPIPTGSLQTSTTDTTSDMSSSSTSEPTIRPLPMTIPSHPPALPHQREASVIARGRISAIAEYESNNTSSTSSSSASITPALDRNVVKLLVPVPSTPPLSTVRAPTAPAVTPKTEIPTTTIPIVRHSTRISKPPTRLGDYAMSTKPKTYAEAVITKSQPDLPFTKSSPELKLHDFKEAIQDEWKSLMDMKVFKKVMRPPGIKAIKSKWVFRIKPNGMKKARLTAKGFMQRYGVNYTETFSPVVNLNTVRTVIALAASQNMSLHQMDVKTAFLNAPLNDTVYMEQPEFYHDGNSENVFVLLKSLYGLKQAPREWFNTLSGKLKALGYKQTKSDPCLFFKQLRNELTLIPFHVDDLKIATNSPTELALLQRGLEESFEITNVTDNKYLGIEIIETSTSVILSQKEYLSDLLDEHDLLHCRTVPVPMINMNLPDATTTPDPTIQHTYRSIIGSLLYAANYTRPDIAFAVNMLARFMHGPTEVHLSAAKHILRYIAGTLDLHIEYQRGVSPNITAYSDANWSDPKDGKSTSGSLITLANAPIIWSSSRQHSVALSTCEAEYIALSVTTQSVIWLRELLKEISFPIGRPTEVYSDNQAAIQLAKNPNSAARTKHINVRFHFLQQHVKNKDITVIYLPTASMPADMLTKALPRIKHSIHTSSLLHKTKY